MVRAIEYFDLTDDYRRFCNLINFLDQYKIGFKIEEGYSFFDKKYYTAVSFDAEKYKEAKAIDFYEFI